MSEFDATFRAFLAEYFRLYPVNATAIGEHGHDGAWPDGSEAGRRERIAFSEAWQRTFTELPDLTPDDAIDRDLILGELAAAHFAETELREDAWNPLDWVYLIGEGIFGLIAREFAPLADRLGSVADRFDGLPALLDGARETLIGVPGLTVARFQTETALKQLPGIAELIDDALAEADAGAADPAVAAVTPRLRAAAGRARDALTAFETHLREVVLPSSEGEGRLGADLFARKMRHTMRAEALTPERILAAAEEQYVAVRAEMVRLARDLWPAWCGDRPPPGDDVALVRGVLDAIAAEHPKADDLLDWCRAETDRIAAFCETQDLIGTGGRATRHPLDPDIPPLVRRRDALHAGPVGPRPGGVLRDHADAR